MLQHDVKKRHVTPVLIISILHLLKVAQSRIIECSGPLETKTPL